MPPGNETSESHEVESIAFSAVGTSNILDTLAVPEDMRPATEPVQLHEKAIPSIPVCSELPIFHFVVVRT